MHAINFNSVSLSTQKNQIMLKLLLFNFFFLIKVSSSVYDYNLPNSHIPYYFKHYPSELQKCLLDDDCPFKNINSHDLPCWGYEEDCKSSSSFSTPNCSLSHKGWAKSKQEQINTFFDQGDFGYVKKHRDSIRILCEPTFKEDTALECSSYLQFCRGRNIFMNFSSLLLRKEPFRYKMDVLSEGNFGGHCRFHKQKLMDLADHVSPLQSWAPEMRYFTSFNKKPIADKWCDVIIQKPVFIMKIDATVNMYHHFCDFFNLYASLHVNMPHSQGFSTDTQIIIWETYPYHSNFGEMWTAFSNHPILTLRNFIGKTVCFKKAVFPLLPRMIFGLYYNTPLIYGCEKSGLFKAFSDFVLHRLKIKEFERNNTKIRVTLLSRETKYRNILNEPQLIDALTQNNSYEVRRIVFNRNIRFTDQLEIIRNTDIFIGMHGAGLTHLLFLPDWAGIFELYNCEDENCYKDLARLRGVKYITWENEKKLFKESEGHHPEGGAHAKFTNYAFDVEEFLRLVEKLAQHVKLHANFMKDAAKFEKDEL